MSGAQDPPKGILALIAVAVACLAAAALLLLRRAPTADGKPQLARIEYSDSGTRDQPAPAEERMLVDAPEEGGGEALLLTDLMDILGAEAARPEVKAIAEEFIKGFEGSPELKQAYRKAARAAFKGERITAKRFLDTLGKMPEFHQLVQRLESEQSSAALLSLYQSPRLALFWQRQARAPSENPAVQKVLAAARARGLTPPDARPGEGRTLAASAGAPASGLPAAEAASSAGWETGSTLKTRAADGGGARGPGEHEVASKLEVIGAANTDPMAIFCAPENYKWLCDALNPGERVGVYNGIGQDGLWGACWKLNLYAKCRGACQSSSGKCQLREGWDSCVEAHESETRCIEECQRQQPCTAPQAVVERHCVVA